MAYSELALYVDSVAYTAVATWAPTHAYTVGQIVRQLAAPSAGNERCFICIVAGTSLSTEPTWVLTRGAKTTEAAGPTWMECTGLPALNGDSTNTNAWHASAGAIAIGPIIKNTAGTAYFICTTAGTGGTGAEPAWNTTAGATTADGSVTWTCLGAISSFSATWKAPGDRLGMMCGSSWLSASGMKIFVGDDHAETASSQQNINPAFQAYILCVDHTASVPPGSSNLMTTATVTDTAAGFSWTIFGSTASYLYVYGITFYKNTSGTVNIVNSSSCLGYFSNCTFKAGNAGSQAVNVGVTGGLPVTFDTCTFNFANASNTFIMNGGVLNFKNCSLTGTAPSAGIQDVGSNGGKVVWEGCDLSLLSQLVIAPSGGGSEVFKDCKVKSGFTIGTVSIGSTIDINRCDSSGTNYRNERHTAFADETIATAVVRTNGASDGSTAVSHRVVTTSNISSANLSPGLSNHQAIPLAIWNAVTLTNRNVTIYGITNDSRVPTSVEVWMDVEYLGSASSPQGSLATGFAGPLATGSALTADTSAWDSAATARVNSHAYSVGDVIKTASNAGRIFFCITAGTSAGSEPGGYATAVDGGSVTDGTATFRAGCRFSQTLTLSAPQPQQAGYLYAYVKCGRPSMTYYLDPLIVLS